MKKIFFVILIVLIILVIFYKKENILKIKAADGNTYVVLKEYAKSDEVAQMMGRINKHILKLLAHLRTKYHIGETDEQILAEGPQHLAYNSQARQIAQRLLFGYNFEVMRENSPEKSGETSYTLDKGKAIYLCARNKLPGFPLVPDAMLLFVTLHEISHIGNISWHHDIKFWETFKFVLHEAEEAGVYTPVDYSKHPDIYCGLKVPYNPYFDNGIQNIYSKI